MKTKIRKHFRNLLALMIRYQRWKFDPKNAEIVYRIELYKSFNRL